MRHFPDEALDQRLGFVGRGRGHVRPGERFHAFVAMRTRFCELILESRCLEVLPLRIRWYLPLPEIACGGVLLRDHDVDAFARRDGFEDVDDMRAFWAETHGRRAFFGTVVRWSPPSVPVLLGTRLVD